MAHGPMGPGRGRFKMRVHDGERPDGEWDREDSRPATESDSESDTRGRVRVVATPDRQFPAHGSGIPEQGNLPPFSLTDAAWSPIPRRIGVLLFVDVPGARSRMSIRQVPHWHGVG